MHEKMRHASVAGSIAGTLTSMLLVDACLRLYSLQLLRSLAWPSAATFRLQTVAVPLAHSATSPTDQHAASSPADQQLLHTL